MHLEAAFCQPDMKLSLKGLGFLLVPTVNQSIVCVPTPWKVWVGPRHPEIKRVMQEQIRQNRADNAPLRGTTRSFNRHTVFVFHWRGQPSFDVE